ncbi:tRNA pseudouridine synthase B [Thermosipho melanesiensis]|uniref:tRNA pseudouridine synthase B n=2 Tax=Thermosipho melanesiensis TaxID=46541 RepID=TRUB_THEM4|nr:tRNA pseudouridine(55) synthase TruB [Thermosipho melanesiensis]A6LLV6.1 RecName: Full=tRNA pseudouridine synthase B; AltName: Full=tRNA pseudouridine(55) synthase; Short=Psi55 synthase; AltName: Full=tRNA pseudouridylate synthase; AltName: Full=tRNA-uridine isomerase [Thermosipho melanesiensis BI429]ABR30907.1 tRNA pseudouridine synthase B [Thermosipho melanesiensis BI429]APT74026.1 tRNA pseudouridine synthase B [Thermosipho melanesiensis]OOC35954.1 tRNA pseudouridine synthase B [Thermosiph
MMGFLNLYKPKGVTSHDVVDEVRRKLNIRRVGHAGTLDPFAEGVLVVGVGSTTRLLEYLQVERKRYYVKALLGVITETFDITGEIVEERECNIPDERIIDVVKSFVGKYKQVPPAYSAKKYKGERLYKLAREGKIISLPPVDVEIYGIDKIIVKKPHFSFEVEVSKGTYIRSLCMDIGYKLGCGATAKELKRLSVGTFDIRDAINPFEVGREKLLESLIDVQKVLPLPKVEIYKDFVENIYNGNQPTLDFVKEMVDSFSKDDDVMLICNGQLVAIAKAERNSKFLEKNLPRGRIFKLKKVFKEI